MAIIYPELENIQRLKVAPTSGEWSLLTYLKDQLDDTYEIFFNPYLDGDRPDLIVLKEHCAVFIIEVKDWNLDKYRVTENNTWEVLSNQKYIKIPSPHSQVFTYKKNLYELHLPVIGLSRLKNPHFYNLVHCFVYTHNATKTDHDLLYSSAIETLNKKIYNKNISFQSKKIPFEEYEKSIKYLEREKKKIERDKAMLFGNDRLQLLIKKIKQNSKNTLFDDNVYQDFKRRLSPSEHTLKQGIRINFDNNQLALTNSAPEMAKIKGVAGCGKTSILAQRAINAFERHHSSTLILTFNITLKNYIRDKISDIQGNRDFEHFEISNYHQFYNSQINNTGQDFNQLIDNYGMEKVYSFDAFKNIDVIKYKTILIDEVQDYEPNWVKIIRDNFLDIDGEMILFGDESQNIYNRTTTRSSVIAQGFNTWKKLNRSYRINLDSRLNNLFNKFQLEFLIEKHIDSELMETKASQHGFSFSLLRYELLDPKNSMKLMLDKIVSYIKSYNLNPNDIVIIASKFYTIRKLNELFITHEKTTCIFETYEELSSITGIEKEKLINYNYDDLLILLNNYKKAIETARRTKKNHFHANSGLIKISSVHSYKGLECKTVFYLMDGNDTVEIVYTAITRSTENLIIIDMTEKNKTSNFFKNEII